MKKLLVTGAGGYIGSIATMRFLEEGYEVVAVDNFSAGYKAPLQYLQKKFGKNALRIYKYELCGNIRTLFEKEKAIDAVVHFAGVCSIDESMKNPTKYFSNNVIASQNRLGMMNEFGIKNILFSSSCSVYAESADEKIRTEDDPLAPGNPYGASKYMVEQTIEWYAKLSGMRYGILRYFNVCGAAADGSLGDSKDPSMLLVHNALLGALELAPFYTTFPEVATPDGSPIRDYVNVLDVIDGHVKTLQYLATSKKSDVFNLGTGEGNSVMYIIRQVNKHSGKHIVVKKNSPRNGDYAKRVASYEKAKRVLGWKPRRSLEDSIASAALWYTKHPQRWIK